MQLHTYLAENCPKKGERAQFRGRNCGCGGRGWGCHPSRLGVNDSGKTNWVLERQNPDHQYVASTNQRCPSVADSFSNLLSQILLLEMGMSEEIVTEKCWHFNDLQEYRADHVEKYYVHVPNVGVSSSPKPMPHGAITGERGHNIQLNLGPRPLHHRTTSCCTQHHPHVFIRPTRSM